MRKIAVILSSVLLVAFMIFIFTGCSSENVDHNISDIRYNIFDGEFQDYSITLVCGLRETPYYPDGIAGEKVEFGIISVVFVDNIEESESVYYSLKVSDNVFSGMLEKSPYTDQYMADVEKVFADSDEISIEIYFNEGAESEYLNLTNKNSDWDVDYEKALSNGISALSTEIEVFKQSGLTYEVHVKILTEQKSNFGEYFWSVTLISSVGTRHNVVFTTDSTDILVKN